MSAAARKFLIILALFLITGAVIGWLYGGWLQGLLVAALLSLLWQARQLLMFERALRTGDFENFRRGEGIWQQVFSRFRFERSRAARRKSSYRRLLKEIRKSTDAMPDGTVILDSNNEIVACNRAAKTLAGLRRRKDKGQHIDYILRDPKLSGLLAGNRFDKSVEIASPIVEGGWLDCRVVPYGAEQKLLLLRDVTERRKLNKMRRDFVANASHELRSPLTVISGYLDSFADAPELPDNWKQPMSQMTAQATRMKHVLHDLLELSRLESAGPAAAENDIDVAALLETVARDFDDSAKTIAVNVVATSQATLKGVRKEIESVVVNLLANAIRHTPDGGTISLAWRSSDKGAEISVADTGVGIDVADLPRLTERFFRVDRGRGRDDGGVGLGLAIVKHILLRHDAGLTIKSDIGVGSEFTCRFPAKRIVTKVK